MAYTDYLDSLFGRQQGSTPAAPSALAQLGGQGQGAFGGQDWAAPLPRGGVFGTQKWMPGNGIDIFTARGTPIYAMFDGTVQPYSVPGGPQGQVPGFLLQGSNGYSMQGVHAQVTAQGRVRKGDVIGYVNDPGLDVLGPYQGMPDAFQHLDLTIGHGSGPFGLTGGDINASQWLQQSGYGQPSVGQTRGPNGGGMGMPGMGMGGPMGQMGGLPGMGMGGPGGPGSMFGLPGMPGMGMPQGPMGMGMSGLPGLGGMGQSPMGQWGGMGSMFGGMGLPPMPMLPMMGGGPAYPGQGFMGFGAGGLQQGLVPGTMGVGGGAGMVTQSPGTYSGAFPPLPQMGGNPFLGGGAQGLGSLFGGIPFGGF